MPRCLFQHETLVIEIGFQNQKQLLILAGIFTGFERVEVLGALCTKNSTDFRALVFKAVLELLVILVNMEIS